MKVKELIEELQKVDGDFEVVISQINEGNLEAFAVERIGTGWEPSGIFEIELGEKILE